MPQLVGHQLYAPGGCCTINGWAEAPVEAKVATVAGVGLVLLLGAIAFSSSGKRRRR